MSLKQITMDAPATSGNGAVINVEGFGDKLIEFVRSSGTFTIEWSKDGMVFNVIVAGLVATGFISTEDAATPIPRAAKFLRVVTTSDGTAVFVFVGSYRGQS